MEVTDNRLGCVGDGFILKYWKQKKTYIALCLYYVRYNEVWSNFIFRFRLFTDN
jgi:hypothetical protein